MRIIVHPRPAAHIQAMLLQQAEAGRLYDRLIMEVCAQLTDGTMRERYKVAHAYARENYPEVIAVLKSDVFGPTPALPLRWPIRYPDLYRTHKIDRALDALFPNQRTAQRDHRCPFCTHEFPADVIHQQHQFKDELSWREFLLTGLCQSCQDDVF